eukprot:694545-Prorocentrum_minimum.AAC.3
MPVEVQISALSGASDRISRLCASIPVTPYSHHLWKLCGIYSTTFIPGGEYGVTRISRVNYPIRGDLASIPIRYLIT